MPLFCSFPFSLFFHFSCHVLSFLLRFFLLVGFRRFGGGHGAPLAPGDDDVEMGVATDEVWTDEKAGEVLARPRRVLPIRPLPLLGL